MSEFRTHAATQVKQATAAAVIGILLLALAFWLVATRAAASPHVVTQLRATAYEHAAVQCRGTALTGARCANRTTSGDYCYRHRNQDPKR